MISRLTQLLRTDANFKNKLGIVDAERQVRPYQTKELPNWLPQDNKTLIVIERQERSFETASAQGIHDLADHELSIYVYSTDESIVDSAPTIIFEALEGKVVNGVPIHLHEPATSEQVYDTEKNHFKEEIKIPFRHNLKSQ